MSGSFNFLEDEFPDLADQGNAAEACLESDPAACMLQLGSIGEAVVERMLACDRISLPAAADAEERIRVLRREGLLPQDLADALCAMQWMGGRAASGHGATAADARAMLETAHDLCTWFRQAYGPEESSARNDVSFSVDASVGPSVREMEACLSPSVMRLWDDDEKDPLAARRRRALQAAGQRRKTEAETRMIIDQQLRQVGWEADTVHLRHAQGVRPEAGRNLAIAEWPTDSTVGDRGFADYALFAGTKLVGIVEAKAAHKDIPSVIDYQCKDYARCIRSKDEPYRAGAWGAFRVPFVFATNGRPYLQQFEIKSGIWFQDLRQAHHTARALQGWMSPGGMLELLGKDEAAADRELEQTPCDLLRDGNGLNLREYQLKAIRAAEEAVRAGRREVLLAMATGTGKTRTVLGMIYRFLKTKRFRRILFLVDRTSLGEQALDVFKSVRLEDLMPLADIYNIKELEDREIDRETRVQVATVQGMVKRILYNDGESKPSVTDYDLIIVDEAHRGYMLDKEMGEDELLYRDQRDYKSKYRAVIDYFDAVKIAMTATPALHTTQIFGRPVFNYTYREAVVEGYLVDHDAPHLLSTHLGSHGIHYGRGETVAVYDPATGAIVDSDELEDELDFDIDKFNRQVVTESFNRTVLEEIARDIDPELKEQGKTLIYAVDDQHADMIVAILKEIYGAYGVDSDAVMKITASAGGGDKKKVMEAIRRFKNERFPSIAVTVDLLTTGIDVPEITTLVFMRRVRSRILFEQMLGRATRLCPDIRKTHFEIYDAVRMYEALQDVNTMKPVVADPSTTMEQLLDGLSVLDDAAQVQNQIDRILARLRRFKRRMDDGTLELFAFETGGLDPDGFADDIRRRSPEEAKNRLLECGEFLGRLSEIQVNGGRAVVVSDRPDHLVGHERGYGRSSRPEDFKEELTPKGKAGMLWGVGLT